MAGILSAYRAVLDGRLDPGTLWQRLREVPGFVDETKNDFHLSSGSNCVDHGNNDAEYLPATDLDGNQRIIGPQVDMGVYER